MMDSLKEVDEALLMIEWHEHDYQNEQASQRIRDIVQELEAENAGLRERMRRYQNIESELDNAIAQRDAAIEDREELKALWEENAPRYRGAPCECRINEETGKIEQWCGLHREIMQGLEEEISKMRESLRTSSYWDLHSRVNRLEAEISKMRAAPTASIHTGATPSAVEQMERDAVDDHHDLDPDDVELKVPAEVWIDAWKGRGVTIVDTYLSKPPWEPTDGVSRNKFIRSDIVDDLEEELEDTRRSRNGWEEWYKEVRAEISKMRKNLET